VTKRNVIAMW